MPRLSEAVRFVGGRAVLAHVEIMQEVKIKDAPGSLSSPVLAVCHCEHLQGKVLDICGRSRLVLDCVIVAEVCLQVLENAKKGEEEFSGG